MDENSKDFMVEWRAYIGPPWRSSSAADYFDWSQMADGDTSLPVAVGDLALFADLEPDETASATLDSAADLPDKGGVWIGPGTAGEAWEYVTYSSKDATHLFGLTRETVDSEQTGHHSMRATVRFWWPLDTAGAELTISQQANDLFSATSWTARLSGVNFPQAALRNYHLCVVQRREHTIVGGMPGVSAWLVSLVGWILEPKAKDDYTREASWSVTIGSSAEVLGSIWARGVRVGPYNTIMQGSASGTTELAKWYKESATGEGIVGTDTFDPGKAIDGALRTLYASERFLGASRVPAVNTIDQVHIASYGGQGKGYRWIQFCLESYGEGRLVNQDGKFISVPATTTNRYIVVVENEGLFRAENTAIKGDVEVIELSAADFTVKHYNSETSTSYHTEAMTVAEWWDSLAPAEGALTLKVYHPSGRGITSILLWGTQTEADVYWKPNDGGNNVWPGWTGDTVAAPAAGQTIRRDYGHTVPPHDAVGWIVGYPSFPGYYLDTGSSEVSQYYCLFEQPGMGLQLAADIDDDDTAIYINVGSSPCTNGLPNSGSFTIQIDSEQITCEKMTDGSGVTASARGAGGTAAASHVAGAVVYFIEDSLSTDAFPLATVVLQRTAGLPTPRQFYIYGSRSIVQPRVLGDGYWWDDYTELAHIVLGDPDPFTDGSYTLTLPGPNYRYRWVMVLVERMSTDPYRMMLNEVSCYAASSVFLTTDYLATATVFEAAQAVLGTCGYKSDAIVDGGSTPTVTGYTTAPDLGWQVVSDLMDMTGCLAQCGRDSKITVGVHPLAWTSASYPAEAMEWTRSTLRRFEPDFGSGRSVGQVELDWQTLDGSASYTARYPAARDIFGDVVKIGPMRLASAVAALCAAEKRYWLRRIPFGGTGEASGAPWAAKPCLVHGVNWLLDSNMLAMDRTWLLDAVDLQLANMGLTVVFHGTQIGRENER